MDVAEETLLPKSGHFKGMCAGDARVPDNARLHVKAMVGGNLIIGKGSVVAFKGMIAGSIINEGGEISIKGMVA